MTESGRSYYGVIIKILRKLTEPLGGCGGHWWPPEGGLAFLEARGGAVPDGIGTVPDRIGSHPILPTRARTRSGWARWNRAATCTGASSEFCESFSSRRVAASGLQRVALASLEARGGVAPHVDAR